MEGWGERAKIRTLVGILEFRPSMPRFLTHTQLVDALLVQYLTRARTEHTSSSTSHRVPTHPPHRTARARSQLHPGAPRNTG